MRLRWLKVTEGHPGAICLNGECRVLQYEDLVPTLFDVGEKEPAAGVSVVWKDVEHQD